jgi:hypothetical protein
VINTNLYGECYVTLFTDCSPAFRDQLRGRFIDCAKLENISKGRRRPASHAYISFLLYFYHHSTSCSYLLHYCIHHNSLNSLKTSLPGNQAELPVEDYLDSDPELVSQSLNYLQTEYQPYCSISIFSKRCHSSQGITGTLTT